MKDTKQLTQKLIAAWDDFNKSNDAIIAIFIFDDELKTLKVRDKKGQKELDKMLKDFYENAVGVYNKNAKFFDILNDLKYTNCEMI